MKNKKIAFIPPNGSVIEQDFFFNRISIFLNSINIEIYLILFDTDDFRAYKSSIYKQLVVNNISELQKLNNEYKFDLILHRCWMHRYKFAAEMVDKFDNIAFYIKDWMDEIPKEEYAFLYQTIEDYDAIKKIFQSGKKVFSHYTYEYTDYLALKYDIPKNNFCFLPEYSCEDNFNIRKTTKYDKNNIKLVWIGGIIPSNRPKKIDEEKIFLDSIVKLSRNNINIDFFILEKYFNKVHDINNFDIWKDWLYEDLFNDNFKIKLGTPMNSDKYDIYNFGIIAGLEYDENCLALKSVRYAIISKLALYMEIGLPLLVNKKWKALSEIVDKNNIGIIIDNEDLNNMDGVFDISQQKYNDMVDSVYEFRKRYTYNKKTLGSVLNLLKL
ncbi:hypothetical protein [Sulfurimonas sp.]